MTNLKLGRRGFPGDQGVDIPARISLDVVDNIMDRVNSKEGKALEKIINEEIRYSSQENYERCGLENME